MLAAMDVSAATTESRPAQRFRSSALSVPAGSAHDMGRADRALLQLGLALKKRDYRFTTITPASHGRVNARHVNGQASLEDIFGWSRAFAPRDIVEDDLMRLADAGELEISGSKFRSGVRFSTLSDQLFVH